MDQKILADSVTLVDKISISKLEVFKKGKSFGFMNSVSYGRFYNTQILGQVGLFHLNVLISHEKLINKIILKACCMFSFANECC